MSGDNTNITRLRLHCTYAFQENHYPPETLPLPPILRFISSNHCHRVQIVLHNPLSLGVAGVGILLEVSGVRPPPNQKRLHLNKNSSGFIPRMGTFTCFILSLVYWLTLVNRVRTVLGTFGHVKHGTYIPFLCEHCCGPSARTTLCPFLTIHHSANAPKIRLPTCLHLSFIRFEAWIRE